MPSESAGAPVSLQLPRDLEPDFGEFRQKVADRLTPEAVQLLARFGQLVYTQVAQLSLVARGDRTVLFTRHILDSLSSIDFQSPPPASGLDIGSGGGFPGIPLAIVWPNTRFTILESREKKAGFLERAVRELGIRNVAVACGRLEEYGRSWTAEPHRSVYIRALGDLPELLRGAERVAVPGAEWVYFLGADTQPERLVAPLGAASQWAEVLPGAFGGRLLRGYFPPGPAPHVSRETSG
ncbi:MAG TPA: 16S rRNA (guanine(527)-N(7))-methyltransferase RsmG [Candidatus Polarisedimenticolia bacterium]|nr:16S rRNA (guanine(527)-N(7))-methyltransferase RsmG [Candidatus Polarisedimenticolia bacterium]